MRGNKFIKKSRWFKLNFESKRLPLWGVALVLSFFVLLTAISVFADSGGFKTNSNNVGLSSLITTGNNKWTIETFVENFNFSIYNSGTHPINRTNITIGQSGATETNFTVNESTIFDPTGWTHNVTYDTGGKILVINWSTSSNPIPVDGNYSFWFDAQAPLVDSNTTPNWFIKTLNTNDEEASLTLDSFVINDGIPPTSTITAPLNNTHWRNPIIVNGTASDPQSGVQYVQFCFIEDGVGLTCVNATGTTSWTYSWTPTNNNLYNITSSATDNLNNTAALCCGQWLYVTYDTVAPFFQYASATPTSFSPNASPGQFDNVTFSTSAKDSLSPTLFYSFQVRNSVNVLIKESGTISAANNTSIEWVWNGTDSSNNFVPEEYYNITIVAWDLAGNNYTTSFPTNGFNITVDNTYPIISNLQPSGTIGDTTPILSLNTNEIATCYYSNISISMATNLFNNTTATFHDQQLELLFGTYTYYVKCYDLALNDVNASTTFTIAPPPPPPPLGGASVGGGGILPTGGKVYVNAPPSVTTIPTLFAKVGVRFTYTVSADDPNDDPLIFTDDTSLFNIGKETGIIAFIPKEGQIGTHKIKITVSDGKLDTSVSFLLVIEPGDEEAATPSAPPAVERPASPTGFLILGRGGWLAALVAALLIGFVAYRYYTRSKYGVTLPAEELPPEEEF